jgi:pimeloyl-ACP methyl ester carboxylesterase
MADLRRLWKRVRQIWIATGITVSAVLATWSLIAYRASAEARGAVNSDSVVEVTHKGGVWRFMPRKGQDVRHTVVVFFPGALVDPRAYAPLARAVAAVGFPTFIVQLPRRGAFGGADAPELQTRFRAILQEQSASTKVVIGGHSRGAVVASRLASHGFANFAGLILIGTSHPRDVDLSSVSMPVVKISGTRDGLATRREVEGNARKLPSSTRWVWVEGGNHSQFGWYGFQPGDWPPRIAASAQREQMVEAVLMTLYEVETGQLTGR